MAPQKVAEGAISLKFVVGDKRSIVCQVPQGFEMQAGYCYYINVEVGQDYVANATYVALLQIGTQEPGEILKETVRL